MIEQDDAAPPLAGLSRAHHPRRARADYRHIKLFRHHPPQSRIKKPTIVSCRARWGQACIPALFTRIRSNAGLTPAFPQYLKLKNARMQA
jgi:hypothetical protein